MCTVVFSSASLEIVTVIEGDRDWLKNGACWTKGDSGELLLDGYKPSGFDICVFLGHFRWDTEKTENRWLNQASQWLHV